MITRQSQAAWKDAEPGSVPLSKVVARTWSSLTKKQPILSCLMSNRTSTFLGRMHHKRVITLWKSTCIENYSSCARLSREMMRSKHFEWRYRPNTGKLAAFADDDSPSQDQPKGSGSARWPTRGHRHWRGGGGLEVFFFPSSISDWLIASCFP